MIDVRKILEQAREGGVKTADRLWKDRAAGKKSMQVKQENEGWEAAILKGMNPQDFGFESQWNQKLKTKAQGFLKYAGELKNATKFNQSNQVPEMIPGAYSMIASLQNAGKTGQPINPITSLGGSSLISQVTSGASSYRSSISQENDENDENPLEAYLRAVYREEQAALVQEKLGLDPPVIYVALEPIDENGNEYTIYIIWRAAYAQILGEEWIDLYNSYDSGVTLVWLGITVETS